MVTSGEEGKKGIEKWGGSWLWHVSYFVYATRTRSANKMSKTHNPYIASKEEELQSCAQAKEDAVEVLSYLFVQLPFVVWAHAQALSLFCSCFFLLWLVLGVCTLGKDKIA